jgi:hypothetical protein
MLLVLEIEETEEEEEVVVEVEEGVGEDSGVIETVSEGEYVGGETERMGLGGSACNPGKWGGWE